MIIYEVNLKISTKIYSKFNKWLDKHIIEMLAFPGFVKCKKYKVIHEGEDSFMCLHYYIKDIDFLNDYFEKKSKNMRQKAINLFGDYIIADRRILSIDT